MHPPAWHERIAYETMSASSLTDIPGFGQRYENSMHNMFSHPRISVRRHIPFPVLGCSRALCFGGAPCAALTLDMSCVSYLEALAGINQDTNKTISVEKGPTHFCLGLELLPSCTMQELAARVSTPPCTRMKKPFHFY